MIKMCSIKLSRSGLINAQHRGIACSVKKYISIDLYINIWNKWDRSGLNDKYGQIIPAICNQVSE